MSSISSGDSDIEITTVLRAMYQFSPLCAEATDVKKCQLGTL
jgi:hypothetical protein